MFKRVHQIKDKDAKTPDLSVFKYLLEVKNLTDSKSSAKTAEDFTQLHHVDQTLKVCTAATVASVMAKI